MSTTLVEQQLSGHRLLELSRQVTVTELPTSRTTLQKKSSELDRYLNRNDHLWEQGLSQPERLAQLKELLSFDLDHMVRELSLIELQTQFQYQVSQQADRLAFYGDGYQEATTLLEATFVHELAQKGLQTQRALIEYLVFEQARATLVQQDPTQPVAVLISSPPGPGWEGYQGCDSYYEWNTPETKHSFHFLMWLIPGPTPQIKVIQYRTWHNMQQLLDLHARLGQPVELTTDPVTSQVLANMMVLPLAEQPLEHLKTKLEQELYQGAEQWGRQPDQAPHLPNPTAFWTEYQDFFERFFWAEAAPLLAKLTPELHQHQPHEYHTAQVRLQTVFKVFMAAIELRVRELNINTKYEDAVQAQVLIDLAGQPQATSAHTKQLKKPRSKPFRRKLRQLHQLVDLQTQHTLDPRSLTKHQTQRYSSLAQDSVSVVNAFFGAGQCFSVGMITGPLQAAQAFSGLSGGFNPEVFQAALQETSLEAKQLAYQELLNRNYQELRLPGTEEVWMVPRSYLYNEDGTPLLRADGSPGCQVTADGQVEGPCGILLSQDPLALRMDQAQFDQYLEMIRQAMTADQLNQVISTVEQKGELTPLEKERLHWLLSVIMAEVTKPSIGLDDLINNNFLNERAFFHPLLSSVIQLVEWSPNPLQALEKVVADLLLTSHPNSSPSAPHRSLSLVYN